MSKDKKNAQTEQELELEKEVEETTSAEEATISKEEELENKIKELEDRYMRLAAEYDNYQKRSQREKEARYADAIIDAVGSILPIADNLERALSLEVESDEAKKVLEGVLMVSKQLDDSLKKLDVKVIEAVGNEFDPNLHNAIMHVEDESIADNTVVEEFMKGYIYKDTRVVRHSMVKVAN